MIKGVKIELAKQKDFEDILKLSNFLDPSEKNKKEKIKNAIAKGCVWIAKKESEIGGYCLVELFNKSHNQFPNSIFLSDLYVLEPYRKKGIGKMLVQKVLEAEYPIQYICFSLTHDPEEEHLTGFYRSFGFNVVGHTPSGNIKMVRKK